MWFPKREAYPDSVPFYEWRINVAAGANEDTGIWDASRRGFGFSVYRNAGGAQFQRVYHYPVGLYIVDVMTFSAGPVTILVRGYHHISASLLGPARTLSTTAVGAGLVGQVSGFRVVTPYADVRVTNTDGVARDVDISVQLRTR